MLLRHAKYALGSVVVLTALLLGASPLVCGQNTKGAPYQSTIEITGSSPSLFTVTNAGLIRFADNEEPAVAPSIVAPVMPPQVNTTIDMRAPEGKIKYGKVTPIMIRGITDDDKFMLTPKFSPDDGNVTWFWGFGGTLLVEAEPEYDTKYQVSIGLNEWRKEQEAIITSLKNAKVPQALIDKQIALNAEFDSQYPLKYGACVLEVAGQKGPFPTTPTDPNLPPVTPPTNPGKITQLTYVYEKDDNPTPRQVRTALQQIQGGSLGIVATEYEQNTPDGTGQVPTQYQIALKAAKEKGLPALVVQSGNVVLKVISDPQTTQQVLDAIK